MNKTSKFKVGDKVKIRWEELVNVIDDQIYEKFIKDKNKIYTVLSIETIFTSYLTKREIVKLNIENITYFFDEELVLVNSDLICKKIK